MEETKEIRCLNKKGSVRWVSEHLVKQPNYLERNELTVQHLGENGEPEKTHFTAIKEKKVDQIPQVQDDEFSKMLEEEEKENKKKE